MERPYASAKGRSSVGISTRIDMPAYAYGKKRNPLFWQGNKIGKAYRYGTLVYQSYQPQWYQGTMPNMSLAREQYSAAAIPNANVVIVAGGATNIPAGAVKTTEMYTEAGVRTTINDLGDKKFTFAGYGYGNYAFFGGGRENSTSNYNSVDRYDGNGVRATASDLSQLLRSNQAAAAGGYVLFAGGYRSALYGAYSNVDAYNQSGVRTSITGLVSSTYEHAGASCDDYAIFGYGLSGSTYRLDISIYNASLVRTSTTGVQSRRLAAATQCGDGVIFAGGGVNSTYSPLRNTVEHVSKAGVVTSFPALTNTRIGISSGYLYNLAVLAGGEESSFSTPTGVKTIEAYNSSGVKVTTGRQLNTARMLPYNGFATLNNTLYIFGGNNMALTSVETISYK